MAEPMSVTITVRGKSATLTLPPAAPDAPDSLFLLGLPKAGSTLLNRIMRPLCRRVGFAEYALHGDAQRLGIAASDLPPEAAALFQPAGYAYVAFRGFPHPFALPDFADERVVALIRDPRDMLVSLYFSVALSHAPPGDELDDKEKRRFEATREKALRSELDAFALEHARGVLANFDMLDKKLTPIGHRLWRYEDVIFEKARWTREMLGYLRMGPPAAMVDAVVSANDVRPEKEAASEHIRRVTPGDHARKLSAETIARLNEIFAPVLERHGYR